MKNAPTLAIGGLDTAENEPSKVCPLSVYRSPGLLVEGLSYVLGSVRLSLPLFSKPSTWFSHETVVLKHGKYETEVPIYQYLSKPLETNRVAVLLMNSGEMTQVLNATFATIPGLDDGIGNGNKYLVRDLWAHKDMGVFKNSVSVPVDSHDASFLLIQKMDSLNTTIS